MNKQTDMDDILRRGWLVAMLLAFLILIPAVRAQPTEQTVQSRFLFVFDTSKNMKPRFEALQKSLNTMLATSLGGQLHAGDSMGVWTFGENLQTKGYPLQTWNPDAAATIASNLVKFVNKQSYAKNTRFEALQPSLNRVMQGSERLTVLIFCDGDGKLSGTPFDDAINRVFQEKSAEQKKARQPFIILLRSQLGQYVGADVFMPPQLVQIPSFPPLPLPPPPKAAKPPPPAPVAVGQPLIIIGKKPPASLPPPVTNPPPAITPVAPVIPVTPVVPTNPPALSTNPVVIKNLEIPPVIPPPALPENPQSGSQNSLLIGAGLLGVVIASALVFRLRPRRKETSLITRSLGERK